MPGKGDNHLLPERPEGCFEQVKRGIQSRREILHFDDKTTLVTGGAGFIGSHLVDLICDRPLRVLDDFSTGSMDNLTIAVDREDVEIIRGDVRDRQLLKHALRGVGTVFHLACRGVRHSIGKPQENHEVNATGTLNVLQAARDAGVERFVHVSSSEVYGTARYVPMDENHPCLPETVYGAAKLAGEAYARAYHQTYGLPTTVVRPFNNFGPRSHFEGDSGEVIPRFCIWALNDQRPVIFGDGSQTRDFIYVEETAYWLATIAACDDLIGRTVNLGSGEETSVLDLARWVYAEAGREGLAPDFRPRRPGDVMRHCADASFARKTLNFQLNTKLRSGIRKTLAHFEEAASSPRDLLPLIDTENWTLIRSDHRPAENAS